MLVSVIVPTWNNQGTIARCLDSLAAQSEADVEVLVVNDGSTDGTAAIVTAMAQRDPRIRLLRTESRGGPGAARNVALRVAQGRYLAFIDGDMSAPPDWLTKMLAPLIAGRADVTGGPDVVPDTAPLLSRCIGYSVDSPLLSGGLRLGTTRLVCYLPGTGNLLMRREVFEQVGQFNEAYVDTGEDKEFLYRIRRLGARIEYLPDALLWHHRAPAFFLHARKMITYGWRRVQIWRAQPDTFEWPHALPAVLVVLALASLLARWVPFWQMTALVAALDGMLAARRLRSVGAFFLAPWTSCVVPFGYGLGILARLLIR